MSRILLIEDDPLLLRLFAIFLESSGYEVVTMTDGIQVLTHLEGETVDLVCCDLHLSGTSGIGVLAAIRTRPRLARIPFILVTGSADVALLDESRWQGVTSVLIKPVLKAKLLSAVQEALLSATNVLD